MTTPHHRMLGAWAMAAAALLPMAAACAAGFERGPAPTAAALGTTGPYALEAFKIPASEARPHNYGGATVYYPKAQGETFGVVAMMPGFLAFQAVYESLVRKIASHGFVVVSMDTVLKGDLPDTRAAELADGLRHVAELARSGAAPYAPVADLSRLAAVGNSMGGGAVLTAGVADHRLKAIVALQPWHTTKRFAGSGVPTMIVACQTDLIAPNKTHSDPFYQSLPAALPRAEIEVRGAGHLCATFLASKAQLDTMGKSTVAWLKRFVDRDMRYDPLVKGGIDEGEFSRFLTGGF